MFKTSNFEAELYHEMGQRLVANQTEQAYGLKRLAQAAEYLNIAAETFEQAGMPERADEITEVLQGLIQQLSGKTS
jgi:hypothetical protein